MKYATLRVDGRTMAATQEAGGWRVLQDRGGRPFSDLGAMLASPDAPVPGQKVLTDGFTFAAPVARPPKIVAVGLNYRDHAAEQNKPAPEKPMLFSKASNIVIGTDEPVKIPSSAGQVDFECELGVIIGKPGLDIPESRALEHVFGFTVVNDVTSREAQYADKQFYRGKSFATFAPCGPIVVTPEEWDWRGKRLTMKMNGKVMQDSTTDGMCFGPPYLVSYISAIHALEPGDLIATGTPAGVLMFRPEKRFLEPGDVTEAWIDGIGTLRNGFEKR